MFAGLQRQSTGGVRRLTKSLTVSFIALLVCTAADLSATPTEIIRGSLLVADESLRDPNFRSTVVLIVGHDNLGTIGVIVNRPTNVTVGQSLPAFIDRTDASALIYFGGPVQIDGFRMLARSATTIPDAIRVAEDIYFVDNPVAVDYVLDSSDDEAPHRFYAGISSWIPGQLALEIQAGAWKVMPFDADVVMSDEPDAVWPQLIEQLKARWVTRQPLRSATARCGLARSQSSIRD